ncbi:hypothetical protein IQ06DRAFT_302808 [Phaeosphaeriaceae sp. SRC1lsM3a]|nr:hypothetical protein IQ06DRAFT_302808 [Stagonospora sp. SRC1lsM3a]
MPELKTEHLELEALVNLRQKIVPLIAQAVSRDRAKVTSLKVLNSWDNVTLEGNQLFLYLKEGQLLSDGDHEDFRSSLMMILSLIENLIDEDPSSTGPKLGEAEKAGEVPDDSVYRKEHGMLGHKRLDALVHQSIHREGSTDLPLSLHLPNREQETAVIEKAVTDFNVNNFARWKREDQRDEDDSGPTNPSHPTNLKIDKTKSNPNIDVVDELQTYTVEVLKVLMSSLANSKCGYNHVARFQVRDPVPSVDSHQGLRHKTFMSTCQTPDGWHETYYEVVTEFRKLNVLIHAKDLYDSKQWELIAQPPLRPILSLEDVLDASGDHFTPGDKMILAANLARELLRMYSSDITIQEITAKDIYFLFNPNNCTVFEGHNPYLAYPLVLPKAREDCGIGPIEKHPNEAGTEKRKDYGHQIRFPMLLALGELLMEIGLGRRMGPYDTRADIALLAEIDPKNYTGDIVNMVGKPYVDAIIKCLRTNQIECDSDSESDYDSDSESESDQNHHSDGQYSPQLGEKDSIEMRKKKKMETEQRLCKDTLVAAVASLEEGRRVFLHNTCLKPPFNFKFNNLTPPRPTVTSASESGVKAGQQVAGEKSLVDVRLKVDQTDSRVGWALKFFKNADDFYESNIQHMPVTESNRIRIAVLDTGVNIEGSFWRGRSRVRQIKSSPIKKTMSFIGDSVHDESGHGTNVAAIISKLAPEADLYIAKISHGKETEGTQQIIDAIEWAVKHNVHIINMSFCLPPNAKNQKVRKVIEKASSDGVIFVAAASNYGNNEPRGFPAKLWHVICVHAVDGNGYKSGLNPAPQKGVKNFGCLGVAVESEWDLDEGYLEGTSYATPVMSGIISNVLRFVQLPRGSLHQKGHV